MKYMTVILAIILTVGLMVGCAQKPPTLTKVEPAMVSATGGTEVTVTGTGFKVSPPPTVTVGGAAVTGKVTATKTTLKFAVPPGTAGAADVVVTNAKAKVKSLPKSITYYDDVAITASVPDIVASIPDAIDPPANVSVTFNQEVDPASVVIKVVGADGAEVAGGPATQDPAAPQTFTFAPTEPFKPGLNTVTVSGAKNATVGMAMQDVTGNFTVKEAAAKPAKKGKK